MSADTHYAHLHGRAQWPKNFWDEFNSSCVNGEFNPQIFEIVSRTSWEGDEVDDGGLM